MTATTSADNDDSQSGGSGPPSAEGSPSSNRSEGSSPGVVTRSMTGTSNNSANNSGRPGSARGPNGRPAGPRRASTADTAAMTGAATVPSASGSALPSAENSPREGGAGGTSTSSSRNNSGGGGGGGGGRNVRTSPNNGASSGPAGAATVPGGQRVPSIARRSVSSGSSDGGGFGGGGGGSGGAAPSASNGPRRSARNQPNPGTNTNTSAGSGSQQPRMAPTGGNIATSSGPASSSGAVGPGGSAAAPAAAAASSSSSPASAARCINPAHEINSRLDAHVEVKVYPCNNNASSQQSKKGKFTQFTIKPEGVIIQGANSRHRTAQSGSGDLGAEYAKHIGRRLRRYELSDTRACQLLVTTHGGSYWAVPAPEAFSRHSGTCRLLGDRKHPLASHTLQVGDFLRVGSVGVVVIETHDGTENKILSEEKIKKIIKDTTSGNGGFLDFGETEDGELVFWLVVGGWYFVIPIVVV